MDNDDATVGTILSRREALSLLGRSSVGLACGAGLLSLSDAAFQNRARQDVRLVASPALTEGPFFVDERLNRSDLVAGTTRKSVIDATPLVLELQILKLRAGKFSALTNVTVDVWHADAAGVYSDESNPMNHEDTSHQAWLRGYQVTGSRAGEHLLLTVKKGVASGYSAKFKIALTDDSFSLRDRGGFGGPPPPLR